MKMNWKQNSISMSTKTANNSTYFGALNYLRSQTICYSYNKNNKAIFI